MTPTCVYKNNLLNRSITVYKSEKNSNLRLKMALIKEKQLFIGNLIGTFLVVRVQTKVPWQKADSF